MAASSEGTSKGLTSRQIAGAALIVMVGFVLSRLTGLIRETIIASIFGGGIAYDSYVAASRPPETLFLVIAGGAIGSAFIPTFADYIAQGKRVEAYRLTNTVANLIFLLMAAIAGLSAIFVHPIVDILLVPKFDPQAQALTAHLLRIMLITPVIYSVSGLMMAFLNAHQRFLLPALAPLLRNLGIILGAVLLSPSIGVFGLAWGAVIGAALHFLIQLPGVLATRFPYRLQLDTRHPGVREVGRLMAPRVLGLAIVQINFWINITLASGMVEGSIGALSRAWYIMLLPQGVIAQSVATAVFPTFAAQVSEGRTSALQRTLGQVLRAVLFLALPAMVGLVMLRQPVVRLIYQYGAFTPENSAATAWALLFYALGLVSHSVVEIVTRAFYAMHDTRTPVLIGGGAMLLNVLLSLLLIRVIGSPDSLTHGPFAGLALANTLATTLEGLALLVLIRPRVGGLDEPRLAASVGRAGAACVAMGVVLWALGPLLIGGMGVIAGTLGTIAVGGTTFWGVAWLLGSEEARQFTGLVLARIGLVRA